MKTAINNNGIEVQVSIDTTVRTIDGIHYLLTPEEEQELADNNAAWEIGNLQRSKDRKLIELSVYYNSNEARQATYNNSMII